MKRLIKLSRDGDIDARRVLHRVRSRIYNFSVGRFDCRHAIRIRGLSCNSPRLIWLVWNVVFNGEGPGERGIGGFMGGCGYGSSDYGTPWGDGFGLYGGHYGYEEGVDDLVVGLCLICKVG